MCNFLLQILCLLLRFFSPGNFVRYASHENWFAGAVELDAAVRSDPADLTARKYYSIFHL